MIRQIRMKKRRMFVNAAENGFKIVSGSVIVQAVQNGMDCIRTGFTVTKKIGCAVVRNRTRRRLKELVRTCPQMDGMIGYDLVFIGRLSTQDRPYAKLQADLVFAIDEIKRHFTKEKEL
ncbi:MAG: ribonuclease P protein component [Pseudomonadota bacterium]|nr:ribonuclease P protein component [Pseudomonadota bacterium]